MFFGFTDETGKVDCAAYEPSGPFREVVRGLIPGDRLRVFGGVRGGASPKGTTFNMEKFDVLELARDLRKVNPTCPECGGSMESMGLGKGYRCRNCSLKGPELAKVTVEEGRSITPGLFMPPPRAQRHLSKPKVRYGREKTGLPHLNLDEPWHCP